MREWGIDVSIYQDWLTPEDVVEFLEEGMTFGIIRLGRPGAPDPLAKRHYDTFQACSVPFILGYIWDDPTKSVTDHLDLLDSALREMPGLMGLAEDVEQWWADWNKWRMWRQKQIAKKDVPVVPQVQISESGRQLWLGLEASGRPSFLYHGLYFPGEYAPQLADWSPSAERHWIPYYPGSVWASTPFKISWDTFHAKINALSSPALKLYNTPHSLPGWDMWQISDKMILPGCPNAIDVNLTNTPMREIFENKVEKWEQMSPVEKDGIVYNLAVSHNQI